ncbi:NADH-quinone oxidoreductase subunit B family protein [Acidithiobacillus sulfuriphilus]|uniref:NADH-quinone oxidoreductase subunit B family protein n=1 Tax=Acidithiobacillus sulfuriphilus TaxID=1867749 RepID=UPI003F5D9F05
MYRILREIIRLGRVGDPPPEPGPAGADGVPGYFRHSLAIRQVDAGSCNGCELEINALNGPHYGLENAGFRFTASPRHADVLLATGPVTRHMAEALRSTYAAMPHPKRVVAVGDCACCGGVFAGSYAVLDGVEAVLPVAVRIPGCPPNPDALLRGLLTAAGEPPLAAEENP